jgi:ABC-type transport system involved in Fe-S cluster assembly fused permease/ATPase subunit
LRGPDSLFNCQREEAFFALWRSLQLDRAIAWSGFTLQLSERRSVLRALEKSATGSCNCVAPDSLLNFQREKVLIAFSRNLRLEYKQKEKKKKKKIVTVNSLLE